VIREWFSRGKEPESDSMGLAPMRAPKARTFQSFLSIKITDLCTIENLTWLAVGVGVALRLMEYIDCRALYMDERSLLINLTNLGVFDFHTMLAEDQLAPPGFLLLERLMVRLPLNMILTARFLPLVCGIASVVLIRLVARRFVSRLAVPIAVGLFALSDWLVYYSNEIKQYSADVALCLIALLLAAMCRVPPPSHRGDESNQADNTSLRNSPLALGAFGIVGVWFSHPLAFVLGGAGTYVIGSAAIRRDWKTAGQGLLFSVAWAASFAACFKVSHAILTRGQFIWIWWDFAFLPLPPHSWADADRVFWQLINVFNSPADVLTPLGVLPSAFVALALFLFGLVALGVRWPGGAYLLVSPLVFALMASALRQYPFHGRLLLFLVPIVHLLVAQGAASLAWLGSLFVRLLAVGLSDRPWIKSAVRATCAAILVMPALLLYEPAAEATYRYAIMRNRWRPFDSHGDLRNDLLDYLDRLEREAKGQ
jgi:hypothetical protein